MGPIAGNRIPLPSRHNWLVILLRHSSQTYSPQPEQDLVAPSPLRHKVLQVGNGDRGGKAGAERMFSGQAKLLQVAQGPGTNPARTVSDPVQDVVVEDDWRHAGGETREAATD